MTTPIDHIAGETYHGRRGAIRNAFRYSIDYVLLDAEAEVSTPSLFGRNRGNLILFADLLVIFLIVAGIYYSGLLRPGFRPAKSDVALS